ncbi:AraC family transcriptional regulator [Leptotrichia sp. OH3620_COT-345]|uniref:AraC family transcriptional regulator n=1 Tax=Leptotrichia sp. OH3620_COT-345 TaxID=2491048 RepID=UPI000F64C5BF|nr:helix-turn-helix domain-containing protein [Leptotrichia sp. OH3620_COT-345]RRD39459.1 AraC family transcriptional regulator [Leptotrichia sp. OH3620_COT-345]
MLKKDKEWVLNIFQFKKPFPIATINAIGRHKITDPQYYWDNMNRSKDGTYCLFQYTINGHGEIKIDGKTYKIGKNEAFFVKIPGKHVYYLPENASSWEVLYVEFSIEVEDFRKQITENAASDILKFTPDSKFVSLLWETFYAATSREIHDIFQCSRYTYNLIFELLNGYNKVEKKKNSLVTENIKKYIKKNYAKPLSIEDISNYTSLSKFHLTRKFKAETGISPGQYLIKTRLKNATSLLLNSNMTIEEISEKVGFSCGNYFAKAFRHKFKISPTKYRNYYKNFYKLNVLSNE